MLVTRDGEVKLLDFGIAKLVGAIAQTQRGMLKGKVGYASPEQCRGQTVDVRADVYSMGVMMWEAIAGCRRAAGETHLAALHARLQNVEADLAAVQPETPLELVHMTRRALAHAPEDRYPHVAALQHDLERYLSRMGWGDLKQEASRLVESKFHDDLLRVRRLAEGEVGPAGGVVDLPRGRGPHLATDDVRERRLARPPRHTVERARRIRPRGIGNKAGRAWALSH